MKNTALIFLALSFFPSCSPSLDDGGIEVSDAMTDATPGPDARAPGSREGEACLVSPDDASGGCASGYACTIIPPGPTQCRQTCPTLQIPCSGYDGPGYSFCALRYTDPDGEPAGNLCLVVCGDENKTLRGCDDGACNGSCPGAWTCQNDPINFGLMSCR